MEGVLWARFSNLKTNVQSKKLNYTSWHLPVQIHQ